MRTGSAGLAALATAALVVVTGCEGHPDAGITSLSARCPAVLAQVPVPAPGTKLQAERASQNIYGLAPARTRLAALATAVSKDLFWLGTDLAGGHFGTVAARRARYTADVHALRAYCARQPGS
jgi:hypothetical protein